VTASVKWFEFLTADFETAWYALAAIDRDIPRGNYMFAHMTAVLASLAIKKWSDTEFVEALGKIDPRYLEKAAFLIEDLLNWEKLYNEEVVPGELDIAITGAVYGQDLSPRENWGKHLEMNGNVLYLNTAKFYCDVRDVILSSGILETA
jgi:hypothetical protein